METHKNNFLPWLLRNLAATGISFMIVYGYALIVLNISSLNPISETIKNFSVTDIYYRMMQPEKNQWLTIVDMTSLRDRDEIARTLEEIEECRPKVIGMDCIFEKEKCDTLADNTLRRMAKHYRNIIYSYKLLNESEDDSVGYTQSVHSFFTNETSVREGVVEFERIDLYSGIKRTLKLRWMLNGNKVPSFAGEIANLYTEDFFAAEADGDLKINFTPTCFTVIKPSNPYDILEHKQLMEGRIVLFGAMTDENDMHYTPLGKMAGVELHAYATQTLLRKNQIKNLPRWLNTIISVLLVMLTNALQLMYLGWTSRSRSPFVRHMMGSTCIIGLITFMWISLLMWGTFICFCHYNVNLELEWSIAAMAFLSTSRSFYTACEDYLSLSLPHWIQLFAGSVKFPNL